MNNNYGKALLRAYGNEPIISYALKTSDGLFRISLKNQVVSDNDWTGWPLDGVFEFNESAYEKLLHLFRNNNIFELERVWKEQKIFNNC